MPNSSSCISNQGEAGSAPRFVDSIITPHISQPSLNPASTSMYPSKRRDVPMTSLRELLSPNLEHNAVPLPEANTLAHRAFINDKMGLITNAAGIIEQFNPEIVLIKFNHSMHVTALRVESSHEQEALNIISQRKDIEYASLDHFKQRQSFRGTFHPNDPSLSRQWHHAKVGSFAAWRFGLGHSSVRIAIVDTPFQMDHPDLAANTAPGWDVINEEVEMAEPGIDHSTLTAGICSSVIHNGIGVAGMGNCQLVPINITGFVSEMYQAIIWAAEHQIRVVNISWDGANEPSLNDAGSILKSKTGGMLVMSGVNPVGYLNYPAYPHIYTVSMTDQVDLQCSAHGEHIDFAAPGWELYGPITQNSFGLDSGTSFAAAIFSGVVGVLMTINPSLSPDEIAEILQFTARDLGQAGWDPYYGWGLIDFHAAAALAASKIGQPMKIIGIRPYSKGMALLIPSTSKAALILWRKISLAGNDWDWIENAQIVVETSMNLLIDPNPPSSQSFYEVQSNFLPTP